MSRFISPYGIRFREDTRIELFPAAEISLVGRDGAGLRALFHIDSGATTSVLPRGDAAHLHISLRKGKRVCVRGITGRPMTGYRHRVSFQLGVLPAFDAPVIFVDSEAVPRILGREGIFEAFGIIFDEAKRRTAFLASADERVMIDTVFSPRA